MALVITDIAPDDPRLPQVLEVLSQLRQSLTLERFRSIYTEGYAQGLRYTASELDGRILAVAGWRLMTCTTAGRRLYVDDLVTDSAARSGGHGKLLLADLEKRARDAGCTSLTLDSGIQRSDAHRFYFRERMMIAAYHFSREL